MLPRRLAHHNGAGAGKTGSDLEPGNPRRRPSLNAQRGANPAIAFAYALDSRQT
jgi:hypothetical protein